MIAVKRLAIRLAFADGHPEVVKLVIVIAEVYRQTAQKSPLTRVGKCLKLPSRKALILNAQNQVFLGDGDTLN
jgi:hypothetical protein